MIDMMMIDDRKKDVAVNQPPQRVVEDVVARRHPRNMSASFVKRRIDRELTIRGI